MIKPSPMAGFTAHRLLGSISIDRDVRLRTEGGSGGHNGLANISSHLGTDAWSRLRIGIDAPRHGQPLEKHVLERFRPDEQDTIDAACDRAADATACWILEGATRTMNEYNPA